MNNKTKICKKLFNLLSEQASKVVIFAGAGISFNSPSSLPLANEVKTAILDALCDESNEIPLKSFYYQHRNEIDINRILMESMFDIILTRSHEFTNQRLFCIVKDIFSKGKPNNNHLFLSRLIKAGCRIITTNFDVLIEEALNRSREPAKEILHIHGSVKEPQSIITILRQVGQGLPREMAEMLQAALKDKILIFIGWRDEDIDVTSLLFSSRIKKIYWIDHNEEDKQELLYYDSIYTPPNLVDKLIQKFTGIKYVGNVDKLIYDLWQKLWQDDPLQNGKRNIDLKNVICELSEIDEYGKYFIFLEILERVDNEKKTLTLELINTIEERVRAKPESRTKLNKSICAELYCKKSVCSRIAGNYEEAIISAQEGLSILDNRKDITWIVELKNDLASAYNDWGIAVREQGDPKDALQKQHKAIDTFKENLNLIDRFLNMAIMQTQPKLSRLHLLDKAQVLTNMGSTYLELHQTAELLSAPGHIANEYLESANRSYEKGIYVHEALKEREGMSEEIGYYNDLKLSDLYNNIANSLSSASQIKEANEYYKKCFDLKKELGDIRGQKRVIYDYDHFITQLRNVPEMIYNEIISDKDILDIAFIEMPVSSSYLLHYKFDLTTLDIEG